MAVRHVAFSLFLICLVVFSQIAYSTIGQTTITSSGTIQYSELFDSCEKISTSNGDWSYVSSYENITIDTQNMVEGSGCFKISISGSTWSSYFWKRPNAAVGWKWDLSAKAMMRFHIFPVDKLPSGGIQFQLVSTESGAWNTHVYPVSNLTINQWNLVTIDLRQDQAGSDMSTALKYCGQVAIIAGVNQVSFTYYLDWFESLSPPTLRLQAKIVPDTANAFAGDSVTLAAIPAYGAGEPFVYLWSTGQTTKQIVVNYSIVGTYPLSCKVYSSNKPSEVVTANATINVVSALPVPTQLHTSGSEILDANNNTVFLRGVNYGGFGDTSSGGFDNASGNDGYKVFRPDVVYATFNAMAKNRLNCIRIMLVMDWWMRNFQGCITFPSSGGIGEYADTSYSPYRDSVTQTVSIANQTGLYVVVSVWTSDYTTYGRRLELPFPSNAFPTAASVTDFWLNISSALSAYPNVIFEFYNEPNGADPTLTTTFDQYYTMVNSTVSAMRQNGFSYPVLCQWGYCGGFNWNPSGGLGQDTDSWLYRASQILQGQTNIIYSNHLYRYHGTFGTPAPLWSDLVSVRNWLWNNTGYKLPVSLNVPTLIGEIGAVYGDATELETFKNALQCLNEWNMSYLAFTWRPGFWKLVDYPMSNPVLSETGGVLVQKIAEGS